MKIQTLESLKNIRNSFLLKKEIVFLSGVFDLFHFGHFNAIHKASKLGDIIIVQIDGNQLVKQRKGDNRPYLDQKIRAFMISSLEFVDYVFISNTPSESKETLDIVKPHIFIRAKRNTESDQDRSEREKNINNNHANTKIVWLPETPEISTTKIINYLNKSKSLAYV